MKNLIITILAVTSLSGCSAILGKFKNIDDKSKVVASNKNTLEKNYGDNISKEDLVENDLLNIPPMSNETIKPILKKENTYKELYVLPQFDIETSLNILKSNILNDGFSLALVEFDKGKNLLKYSSNEIEKNSEYNFKINNFSLNMEFENNKEILVSYIESENNTDYKKVISLDLNVLCTTTFEIKENIYLICIK